MTDVYHPLDGTPILGGVPPNMPETPWQDTRIPIRELDIFRSAPQVPPPEAPISLPKGLFRDEKVGFLDAAAASSSCTSLPTQPRVVRQGTVALRPDETITLIPDFENMLPDEDDPVTEATVAKRNRRVGMFVFGYCAPAAFDAVYTLVAAGDMILDGGISSHATKLWLAHNAATTAVVAFGNIAWLTVASKVNGWLKRHAEDT